MSIWYFRQCPTTIRLWHDQLQFNLTLAEAFRGCTGLRLAPTRKNLAALTMAAVSPLRYDRHAEDFDPLGEAWREAGASYRPPLFC